MRTSNGGLFRKFCVFAAVAAFSPAGVAKGAVSFNRDIRPIMSDTCFRCHGPDKNVRVAGLRLDLRDEALKPTQTGAVPIVPGDPQRSAIIQRIFAENPARVMPPKYAHKELSTAQKELFRQWVIEGAKYEGHWAYQPIRRPAVPQQVSNPIDAFIQSRLVREGLKASPEADRRTLIRRVTLDLTGLPPSSEEVGVFLKDASPGAYETLVDRLLASPRYAEKRAMHWLDAVRYADTSGFHGDNPLPAWPYRDYVLRAFRDNKPFDEFTREQIAGDLLPEATVEQKIASAYNRLNRTSAEGGLQPKEYLSKYASDRVRTTSAVWLGSTLGCAECHDHKFDPFTSKDFYSMEAFFADIQETGLVMDKGPKAWGTQLSLPSDSQREQRDQLGHRLAEARRVLEVRGPKPAPQAGQLAWQAQRPVAATSTNGAKLTIYNDEPVENTYSAGASIVTDRKPGNGLIVASGPNPDNETYIVTLKPGAGTWTALAIDVVQDEDLPGVRVARGADRLVLTEVEAELSPDGTGPAQKIAFTLATSNISNPSLEHPAMAAIDGNPKTGWGVSTYGDNSLSLALRFAESLRTQAGSIMTVRLRHDSDYRRATIGRFRLALSSSEWASPELQPLIVEVAKLESELGMLEAAIPRVVVTESTTPRVTRILSRGNWMDDSGAIVEPAVPASLGKLDTGGRRATRQDLANWLVSPENPLTARVFVNRLWRQFFGTGLSKVLEDVGSQGEWPTHPELLDWLAAEFIRPSWKSENAHPWDVKHLIRTIVTSHTYRQSSTSNPQLDERDPDNRLLARQSRFRVDAELVRDVALAVSGLLADKFGGPSAKPYQPDGYLTALNFPKREYSASHGEDLYRRGLYTHWQRTFLHPSLLTFDAPPREECTVNRVNSNTPLQALVLLNDPTYMEAARVFAQNILQAGGRSLRNRIDWAFLRAVNRKPTRKERGILMDLHRKNLVRFRAAPADAQEFIHSGEAPLSNQVKPVELAAMTTVARAILNLHETITRN